MRNISFTDAEVGDLFHVTSEWMSDVLGYDGPDEGGHVLVLERTEDYWMVIDLTNTDNGPVPVTYADDPDEGATYISGGHADVDAALNALMAQAEEIDADGEEE